ncbi:MAG: hypothetical protein GY711_26660 [bacterium]|nr:hypothetical protein [bacterium]
MRILPLATLLVTAACSSLADRAPRDPEIFGPGTVSTRGREFATSFEPDGKTVYVSLVDDGRIYLMRSRADGDAWTAQERVPFSDGSYPIVDPFVSFDGERMYFSSSGPPAGGGSSAGFDLWYVERDGGDWSGAPIRIDAVSGPGSDVFSTLTRDGDLFFSSRMEGEPRVLVRARRDGDSWLAPEPIDVGLGAASLGNPLVTPDGSFLVFTAELPSCRTGSAASICT